MEIDNVGVRRAFPDGTVEDVRWDDLEAIDIVTTDEGPFVEDVFWVFYGKHGGCVIPGELGSQILSFANQFPGWDTSAVIASMGSTENAWFRVWTRGQPSDGEVGAP